MKNVNKMNKEELKSYCEELEEKISILEQDINYYSIENSEMESELYKLRMEKVTAVPGLDNYIKDIDNFKFELSKNGLDTKELLNFINNYLKYYN